MAKRRITPAYTTRLGRRVRIWHNDGRLTAVAHQSLAQSARELSQVQPLNVPVTMLVGTQNQHPADPGEYARKLSPATRLIFAANSGHWIQLDEPELVAAAIKELVANAGALADSRRR